jgi:hypothetical protein
MIILPIRSSGLKLIPWLARSANDVELTYNLEQSSLSTSNSDGIEGGGNTPYRSYLRQSQKVLRSTRSIKAIVTEQNGMAER